MFYALICKLYYFDYKTYLVHLFTGYIKTSFCHGISIVRDLGSETVILCLRLVHGNCGQTIEDIVTKTRPVLCFLISDF